MVVGAISSRTELAIIGSGPGGYVAALRAADAGLDVTLIDRAELGGTCLNVGCIPSKALIEVASVRHRAMHAQPLGLDAQIQVRMAGIQRHLATVTGRLRSGVQTLLRDAGVSVVSGEANFARYDRLSIAHEDQVSHLEFDHCILATGSRPVELPHFPFADGVVSSTGALALTDLPRSLAIIGGGYIGIELGTAFAKLGAAVTIIEAAPTILPNTAAALRGPVERKLGELGVEVHTSERADRPTAAGILLESGHEVEAEVVVVAVGRRPNSDQASIDILDLAVGPDDLIIVDHQMRATRGIYAVGDLVAGPALAHKASAQAEVAVDAILGRPSSFEGSVVPEVIFSDPEIMTVGVSLQQAEHSELQVFRFPHSASARAHTVGVDTGGTYLVVDAADTVVGVHAVGPHASELAGEAALAIEMAASVEDLALTIHAHPTISESLSEAALLARGMPLHIRR